LDRYELGENGSDAFWSAMLREIRKPFSVSPATADGTLAKPIARTFDQRAAQNRASAFAAGPVGHLFGAGTGRETTDVRPPFLPRFAAYRVTPPNRGKGIIRNRRQTFASRPLRDRQVPEHRPAGESVRNLAV